jgi:hypothetical protein
MDDPNFFFLAEGVVFLRPKKIIDEISEGSTSMNRAKGSLSVCFHPMSNSSFTPWSDYRLFNPYERHSR